MSDMCHFNIGTLMTPVRLCIAMFSSHSFDKISSCRDKRRNIVWMSEMFNEMNASFNYATLTGVKIFIILVFSWECYEANTTNFQINFNISFSLTLFQFVFSLASLFFLLKLISSICSISCLLGKLF